MLISIRATLSMVYNGFSQKRFFILFLRTVPELEILTILPDLTLNFGRQVRQARLPTITAAALGPSY